MDMKTRIETELSGKEASTFRELNLDSCRATQIEGLTDDWTSLEILSLINVGLTTLNGFPKLPNLRKLDLGDNQIANGMYNLIGCPQLTHLNLSNNQISEWDVLTPLAKLENLSRLDLSNCEIARDVEYKEKIWKMLPNLSFLDGFDRNDQEDVEEDESEDDEEEGVEDENEVGLSYLQKSNLPEEDIADADFDAKKALENADDDEEDDEEEEEVLDGDLEVIAVEASEVIPAKTRSGAITDTETTTKTTSEEVVAVEEDEEEEDDEDDEEDDETDVGLSYLQKSNLPEDDDDADFDEKKALEKAEEEDSEDSEDDDEIDEDELDVDEQVEETTSLKRKHEEVEEDN